MKNLLPGFLLLVILFCVCLLNTVFLKLELSAIKHEIQESLSLSQEEAYIAIYNSNKRWESLKKYSNLVLREGKSDAISTLFIDAMEAPEDRALKKHLIFQLDSIISTEMPGLGSIF